MKKDKYYILKRATPQLIDDYCRELEKCPKIDRTKKLVLVEKTCNDDSTETYTNVWAIDEGCEILWRKYVKNKVMYDYTCASVYCVRHEKEQITVLR